MGCWKMSKMEFLDTKEAEKFKKKSGNSIVGHPVVTYVLMMKWIQIEKNTII